VSLVNAAKISHGRVLLHVVATIKPAALAICIAQLPTLELPPHTSNTFVSVFDALRSSPGSGKPRLSF